LHTGQQFIAAIQTQHSFQHHEDKGKEEEEQRYRKRSKLRKRKNGKTTKKPKQNEI